LVSKISQTSEKGTKELIGSSDYVSQQNKYFKNNEQINFTWHYSTCNHSAHWLVNLVPLRISANELKISFG